MGFLSSFSGIINDQFGIGENTSHSLDNVSDGVVRSGYDKLGDFAKKIDQSAERYYMEDGFIRDIRPRKRSILFQQPDFYVVIKKRMFSSLQDNVRLDLLEEKERILVTATKRLFQNKTRLLAAYEKLTKIEQLTFESDRFNTYLGPQFLNLLDSGDFFNLFDLSASTKSAIDKLRKVLSYSQPGQYSNWTINDWDSAFSDQVGEGPGTFELTNISSIKTSVSTDWGSGSASLTLEDPYNLLTITEKDIDQALTDVTNPMRTGSFFKFTDIELQNRINELKTELAVMRKARQASNISFKISAGSVLSKRVRAIIDDEGVEIKFTYQNGIQDAFTGFDGASNVWDVATSVGGLFSNGSVQIEPQFISDEDDLGMGTNNQLNSSERQKFIEIISNIFTLLDQRQTSRRELIKRNKEINYARNRMRLFFNGKYVIQPMDTITIWMNSRTGEDARLPGGFSRQPNDQGFNLSQKFDTIIQNINTTLDSLHDPTGDFSKNLSFNDIERLAIAGPDVPNWLWNQFKQDFTSQPTGPCIFSGLVGKKGIGVSGSWSDGKWTITAQCEDNTGYFDKSQINFKPSPDVFNSSIYDPLTPFDVSFDAATGTPVTDISEGDFPPLLPENQKLLQSGLLTFRSGDNKGNTATESLYGKPSKEIAFDNFSAVLHNPEGMVYRWKQGIQTLTKTSRPNPQTTIDQERTILLTSSPFAGQDIMNVVSLLITGQPYNYGNFLKAAIANGNSIGAGDSVSNISAAQTYIQGLLTDIERTNLTWGNFVPYKKLTINSNFEKFISEQRLDIVTQNARLQQKLRERAKLEDQLLLQVGFEDVGGAFTYDEGGRAVAAKPQSSSGAAVDSQGVGTGIQTKIESLSQEISQLQTEFDATVSNPLANNQDIGLTLIGNDINANPSYNSGSDARASTAQKQRDELQLRQKLFKFTARRFWQVRANDDKNLFIVDDQYDKNFDIMAFERKLAEKGNISTFNSQYLTISDQIQNVRKLMGLECFANTQGHIEIRPPLYNRMPSSVFYKMFKDRDTTGVKVFPDFLESLYFSQIKNIFNQIEVIEDEIRLRSIALGARDDSEIVKMITSGQGSATSKDFWFCTKFEGDGRIGAGTPIQSLIVQNNPDFSEGWQSDALEGLGNWSTGINKQLKLSKIFTPSIQANAIVNFNPNPQPNRQIEIAENIRARLRIKTGQEPKKISELFGNPEFKRSVGLASASVRVSQLDRVNVMSQIGNFISQRQQLLKSVVNAIKHLKEGVSVNAPDGQNDNIFQGGSNNITKPTASKNPADALTTPFLNRKTEIPQFLEHMIEYEDEDDIGYQSGRRFVITADRIISLTISENPPPYTMVTVNGLFGDGFVDKGSLGPFQTSSDGNAITSAYAVDYDMWYQYGFLTPNSIEAPFLSDPDTQCAPYAVATLIAARENILQGQVEVAGYNEFYQPGDVVYIEDRNLLFYVRQVDHSCSYGKLSTTLQLTYGHSPGEYIPTMLDVVGKIMYASGVKTQIRSERQQMLGSARSVGALAFVPKGEYSVFEDTSTLESILRGSYGERNKNILSNTLFAVSGSLNQVNFRRQKTKIKLVYYKTANVDETELYGLASDVMMWLLFPEECSPSSLSIDLSPLKMSGESSQKTFGLNEEDIIIEEVDMTDVNNKTRRQMFPNKLEPVKDTQGPSNAAFAVTRALDVSDSSPDQFRDLLAKSVLDIFVSYEAVYNPPTSATGGQSQAEQAAADAVETARTSR
jgi:hypothetical protein